MLTATSPSCNSKSYRTASLVAAAAALLLFGGCASIEVESQSFRVAKDSQIESAQVAIDADFSQYRQILASELGIYFPQSSITTADDIARIRLIFRAAFLEQLQGYNIVSEPGPGTMTVEASLVDMRNASSNEIPHMRRDVREMANPGSIVFLMEMRDSVSDHVLARAADSARAPTIATAEGTETDWPSIEQAAVHWAKLFRTFLDENFTH